MSKIHVELFISVVQRPSDQRSEFECADMVPWFQNHSSLLQTLPEEIVADVIRHCEYERKEKNDVLIKQGDSGDKLYIILRGSVSIYVIHDNKDDHKEVLKQVNAACAAHDFDRSNLGQYAWTGGEGKCFGEVALLKEDCIRTATVVADGDTDLVVIDRNLYNRSVRDVLEREYQLKTRFVEGSSLFKDWPAKQKKLLVVALKKENMKYGSYLLRQGSPTENMFFLLSGEVEITCDQSQFKNQYADSWREMETLLPGLLPRRHSESPHDRLKRKKAQRKVLQMCLLGKNETIGAHAVALGLPTSLDNAMVTREAEVLMLSRANFERLFNRKYAQGTLKKMRERLILRLYLYIHRAESVHPELKSPFLKFLTFLLQDERAVDDLKKRKRREREIKKGLIHNVDEDESEFKEGTKEAEQFEGMLKMLDINPKAAHKKLPSVESSQRVIDEIEAGLRSWVERSRSGNSPIPPSANNSLEPVQYGDRRKSFNDGLLRPKSKYHQMQALDRPKTPTK